MFVCWLSCWDLLPFGCIIWVLGLNQHGDNFYQRCNKNNKSSFFVQFASVLMCISYIRILALSFIKPSYMCSMYISIFELLCVSYHDVCKLVFINECTRFSELTIVLFVQLFDTLYFRWFYLNLCFIYFCCIFSYNLKNKQFCIAGTETNPFSLDALAIFTFRVLNRVNHPVRSGFYILNFDFSFTLDANPLFAVRCIGESWQGISKCLLCLASFLQPLWWQGSIHL